MSCAGPDVVWPNGTRANLPRDVLTAAAVNEWTKLANAATLDNATGKQTIQIEDK